MKTRKTRKKTNRQVADIIECEGLGYAIQHYLSPNDIEDEELARAWSEAKRALDHVEEVLQDEFEEIEEET